MFKKLASIAAAALLLSTATAANADQVWNVDSRTASGNTYFTINEVAGGYTERNARDSKDAVTCAGGFSEGACDLSKNGFSAFAWQIMPICETDSAEDCLASFSMIKEDGTVLPAKFLRNIDGPKFPADPNYDLPRASTHALFSVEGATHGGATDTYTVVAKARYLKNSSESKFRVESFDVELYPYREISGPEFRTVQYNVQRDSFGNPSPGYSSSNYLGCIWADNGHCGVRQNFGEVTKAKVTVRISKQISGWFKGRLTNPELAIRPFSANNVEVDVAGGTTDIPMFLAKVANSTISKVQKEAWEKEAHEGGGVSGGAVPDALIYNSQPFSPIALEWITRFRDTAGDKADGVTSAWSFGTMVKRSFNSCLEDSSKILGLVTTNSMAYDGTPPAFQGGTLNYKVAGMHYLPDGTLAQGKYTLVIRDSVAQCLYKFSNAPISASVSVVDEKGEAVTATTTVSQKDGWLTLSAVGFTFSSKTLQVKLTQKAAAKKTITCVKGKMVKKVTGTSPKCPAGYKTK